MYASSSPRERTVSGLLSGLIVLGVGWAFVSGLGASVVQRTGEALQAFDVLPPRAPPLERIVPKRMKVKRPEGAAAPPNLRSKASEVVAPVPIVVPPVPPPVIAAPKAGTGFEASQGAADRPGPGTGLGGIGNGTGSGRWGDGNGDGYGAETEPRWLRGRLKFSDYPDELPEPPASGVKVELRCTLETTGRVTNCLIARSSGYAMLDRKTGALVEQRFRYTPWRDGYGRPVRSIILVSHEWGLME